MVGSDFLARHPATEHPYLLAVHQALVQGKCEVVAPSSPVECDELLRTYRLRASHLEQFRTSHAIELHRDFQRFCQRLAASSGRTIDWWSFRVAGLQYVFAERTDTLELLGTLKRVSQLDVSPEEWQRLWNG